MYHTTVNSGRSRKLNFDQLLPKIMDLKAIYIRILMVLTPSRYLNWFQSYYSLNIDMSKFFTNINHDDVRRHDSTVHYIFYDDVRPHDSSKLVKFRIANIMPSVRFRLVTVLD